MLEDIAIPASLKGGAIGAYYMRVSTLEQSRAKADPLGRQRLNLDMLGEIVGRPHADHIYIDRQSGKRDDRPQLQKLLTGAQSGVIQWVACDRIDRIGRDIEHNLKLWKIFKEAGCQLFIFNWARFLSFADYNQQADDDYYRFVNDSIDAQKESKIKGMRIYAGHKYSQHLGKANYVLPFGYARTEDGHAVLDTSQYSDKFSVLDIAYGRRDIYLETGSFKETSRRMHREFSHDVTDVGLNRWLFSPVLRGHMPRYADPNAMSYTKRYMSREGAKIDYNTHLDHIIITEAQYRQIEELHRRSGGLRVPKNRKATPLAGLCRCANCGFRLSMIGWRNADGMVRGLACQGRRIKSHKSVCASLPPGGPQSIRYSTVEAALIEALSRRAVEISESLVKTTDTVVRPPTKEELEIQNQLTRLEQLEREIGADFSVEKTKLRAKLERPEQEKPDEFLVHELTSLFSMPESGGIMEMIGDSEKREIFHRFTDVILVNRDVITEVRLRV